MTEALAQWTDRLVAASGLKAGDRFLDVGGGTGKLAHSITCETGAWAVVADRMIPTAAPKDDEPIAFVGVSATSLPFGDASFDAVLLSHVLHHLRVPVAAVREAVRVLRPGKTMMIRTASHADLRALPHARFIASLLKINLESVPDIDAVEDMLVRCGLEVQAKDTFLTKRDESLEEYAEGVAFQAWREWALAPVGQEDPRDRVREWAMSEFKEAPPVQETLIIARRAA